jgi:predicted RNA-binding Zn-ribbon protein involved in translation (DUF1610 family)
MAPPTPGADEPGTLRGVITIVGEGNLRDGEVVVSYSGTSDLAGSASFDRASPEYSLQLPPGEYDVYAWAPVHHNSSRVQVTVSSNATTWLNLTVVRIEELIGNVTRPDGRPLSGVVFQLYEGTSIQDSWQTDSGGKFRVLIDPGEYRLIAMKSGYVRLERSISVEPGQTSTVGLVMEPTPGDEEGEGFPLEAMLVLVFIMVAAGASLGYMARQARRVRMARMEAEANRVQDSECLECGARIPAGEGRCPSCGHMLSVRCNECGRSMDAGTEVCPECGNPMA